MSIAPLIFEHRVPAWPSLVSDDDELKAAIIARELAGMTQEQWSEVVELATTLLALPSSKRALTALSGALLERGAITGDEATQIVDAEVMSANHGEILDDRSSIEAGGYSPRLSVD